MRNNYYAPHYAISRYSIREFKTGAEPFMVAIIIIIIIIIIKLVIDVVTELGSLDASLDGSTDGSLEGFSCCHSHRLSSHQ